jgi:hypothetical protein
VKKTRAPQAEFGFSAEPFALLAETAEDGARVTQERRESQQRLELFEAAQPPLFNAETQRRKGAS